MIVQYLGRIVLGAVDRDEVQRAQTHSDSKVSTSYNTSQTKYTAVTRYWDIYLPNDIRIQKYPHPTTNLDNDCGLAAAVRPFRLCTADAAAGLSLSPPHAAALQRPPRSLRRPLGPGARTGAAARLGISRPPPDRVRSVGRPVSLWRRTGRRLVYPLSSVSVASLDYGGSAGRAARPPRPLPAR